MPMLAAPSIAPTESKPSEASGAARLLSLDALRGFDMFWIIGGGAILNGLIKAVGEPLDWLRPQLQHVPWAGLHFWDLIWPLFMFIVGVSIPLSIGKRVRALVNGLTALSKPLLRQAELLSVQG